MKVEIDIYVNNIIKFFNSNPNDLMNLVPIDKKNEFYDKIKVLAAQNYEDKSDPALTKKQFLDICLEVNGKKDAEPLEKTILELSVPIVVTKWGNYSLN